MKLGKMADYPTGWIIGDFVPSLVRTQDFEVGIKTFRKGELEPNHYQKSSRELTICLTGSVRMGSVEFATGDVLLVEPFEVLDFECIEDATLVVIKFPSLPSDKVIP